MDDTRQKSLEEKLAKINNLLKEKNVDLRQHDSDLIQQQQQQVILEKQQNKDENKKKEHQILDQSKKIKKQENHNIHKGHLRMVAGQVWEDETMETWPENDFRIFVGNLGKEVTDEILAIGFRKYQSFYKAKVIVDKRSKRTKGYGFVSILDPQDYLKALKEMNNKYIGNRPVKLTPSNWKVINLSKKREYDPEGTDLRLEFQKNNSKNDNQ